MAPKAMKWQSGDQVTRDPSKAFESINFYRLMDKLDAHGFNKSSL